MNTGTEPRRIGLCTVVNFISKQLSFLIDILNIATCISDYKWGLDW
jgi:hypothetical protein